MAGMIPPVFSKSITTPSVLMQIPPLRTLARVRGSILDEAEHLERAQPLAALEEAQFYQHRAADDLAVGLLHQLAGGLEGAAGGQEVIDDQDPGPRLDAVDVHLQLGGTVFQLVL